MVVPEFIKKLVVDAFEEKTTPLPSLEVLENSTLFSVLVPTINPERYCVVVPLNVVVPSVDIILPVFEKLPPISSSVDGKVVVPVIMAKLLVVLAWFPLKLHEPPPPLNSKL